MREPNLVHISWLKANGFVYNPAIHAWTTPGGGLVSDRYLAELPESSRIQPRRKAMRKSPHAHR